MAEDVTVLELTQPVLLAGTPVDQAAAAMIMMHGRGATAQDIMMSVPALHHPEFAYLAPQAPDNTWYPQRFMVPLADNEPYLSRSLNLVDEVVSYVTQAGIPAERIILFGFSQGGCLTLEYAARHAQRYGAVIGLSAGLIGPDDLERDYHGSFQATPVFLGCSDVDFHIPKYRVEHAAEIFRGLGGKVTMRLYPNMDHTINGDELAFVAGLMAAVKAS